MVFSGLTFLFLFLPLFLAVYFLAPRRLKNAVLFLFSLLFYAWGEPVYVGLMLFSTVLDYTCGRVIGRAPGKRRAKAALLVSVIVNLGLLAVFKYADFLVANVNALTGASFAEPHLPLPLGISFYTFQTMSYTIDVYRGEVPAQRNLLSFGAYVSLFPQLIAGPIVRYRTVAEALDGRTHSAERFGSGAKRFVTGLGKKVLLANQLGLIWTAMSEVPVAERTVAGAWLGIVAFALQLYFDFSGYSDMAIGLGRMVGFDFEENFRYPYVATGMTDFWRRWHISLGTWFRDYVYIPLGGNRRGRAVQARNVAIVWLLTGLWHGASWTFVLWGAYHGALLMLEKTVRRRVRARVPAAVRRLVTIFAVLIGWVLFTADSVAAAGAYLRVMFGGAPFGDGPTWYHLLTSLPLLLFAAAAATPLGSRFYRRLGQRWNETRLAFADCAGLAVVFALSVAYLIGSSYNPFLYFRF